MPAKGVKMIERTLIHPSPEHFDTLYPDACALWVSWMALPTTMVIKDGDWDGLRKTDYLNTLDSVTGLPHVQGELIVGGQASTRCVREHLYHLAIHPRVLDHEVHILLDRVATIQDPHLLSEDFDRIRGELGVVIEFV